MSDPYKVLGVSRDATDDEVKKAYRTLSKKYHPDANVNNPNREKAEEMFKLVQEAYQQIMYERQHPYASAGGPGGYGSGTQGGYGGQQGYGGPQYANDPEEFFNQFFSGAFGGAYYGGQQGGHGYGQQTQRQESEESMHLRAAANYIRSGHYREALNVLSGIQDHSSMWYYYSAIANSGLGNNVAALDHAKMALQMEPDNYMYQNLVNRLQSGSQWYQRQSSPYQVRNTGGEWCMRMILLNLVLNFCCGGGGLCCGRYPY